MDVSLDRTDILAIFQTIRQWPLIGLIIDQSGAAITNPAKTGKICDKNLNEYLAWKKKIKTIKPGQG